MHEEAEHLRVRQSRPVKPDVQLLREASTDDSAFREFYDRYVEAIYRFQVARTRDRDAAHDLTAETFAQAWLAHKHFHDLADGSAAPWLYAIARHVLIASVRKRELERSALTRLGLLLGHDHVNGSEPTELWLEGLDEAVAELPDEIRLALELRVVDELPYAEVAQNVGTTAGAARVRVHRALQRLRERLPKTKEAER
jgi:RNA polymerase sigma factor (sigma-70 family)